MSLTRELTALLRRRGYRLTGAVRAGLADFVAVVAEEYPDLDADGDDDDAEEAEDDAELDDAGLARNQDITCQHCGEPIEVAIDLSADDQDGIQDCSVCCRPIRIRYSVDHGRLGGFSADPA